MPIENNKLVKPDYTGMGIGFMKSNEKVAKPTFKGNSINRLIADNVTPYGGWAGSGGKYVVDNNTLFELSRKYDNKEISFN
jgi:hypothetical protein